MNMEMSIFDFLTIKIKFRGIDENPLAIVTLNLNQEAEVRFCPIFWKGNKTELFFTMPSLGKFGNQKSFIVLDEAKFKNLTAQVIQEFKQKAKEHYHPKEYELIENALSPKIEDIDPDEIPF